MIALFMMCLFIGPYFRNNILLSKYANQLYTISLPANTVQISSDKAVGNLGPTGSHLDFWAMIEIESLLSESELNAYYSTKSINIKSVEEISICGMDTFYSETYIDHSVQEIEVFPKAQARHSYASKTFYKSDIVDHGTDENVFIIQIKDTHYAPGWDLRTR